MRPGSIDHFGYAFRKPGKGHLSPNNPNVPACKLCSYSILPDVPRVWLRKPMGLSHTTCAEGRTDIEYV